MTSCNSQSKFVHILFSNFTCRFINFMLLIIFMFQNYNHRFNRRTSFFLPNINKHHNLLSRLPYTEFALPLPHHPKTNWNAWPPNSWHSFQHIMLDYYYLNLQTLILTNKVWSSFFRHATPAAFRLNNFLNKSF